MANWIFRNVALNSVHFYSIRKNSQHFFGRDSRIASDVRENRLNDYYFEFAFKIIINNLLYDIRIYLIPIYDSSFTTLCVVKTNFYRGKGFLKKTTKTN